MPGAEVIATSATMGIGATVTIDLWALLLRRGFGIPSLDFRLLGRWVLHMPSGTFRHRNIAAAPARRFEGIAGWLTHYLIGISLAVAFVMLVGPSWLLRPTLFPALAFGVATVLAPFLILQPALGFGIASSRADRPGAARLRSLATHTVFGLGLYAWAMLANGLR